MPCITILGTPLGYILIIITMRYDDRRESPVPSAEIFSRNRGWTERTSSLFLFLSKRCVSHHHKSISITMRTFHACLPVFLWLLFPLSFISILVVIIKIVYVKEETSVEDTHKGRCWETMTGLLMSVVLFRHRSWYQLYSDEKTSTVSREAEVTLLLFRITRAVQLHCIARCGVTQKSPFLPFSRQEFWES